MWRPVLAKVVTMAEIKSGIVTLVDLVKINALLDMRDDTAAYYAKHPQTKDGEAKW